MKKKLASEPGFSNARLLLGLALFLAGILLGLVAWAGFTPNRENETHVNQPVTGYLSVFRGDVRDLPQAPQTESIARPELKEPYDYKRVLPEALARQEPEANIPMAPMPNPIRNFAGLSLADNCVGGQCGSGPPPDTNGDVGPNHYIQTVNSAFAIYSKTGALLAARTENALFAQSGSPCDGNSRGDPIVLYDPIADRWILTNLAFAVDSDGHPLSPFYQCIAVSATSDPVGGGWFRYSFRMDTGGANQPPVNTLNDYPKFGIWADGCLYYSANGFDASTRSYTGGEWGTFPLSDMYAGQSTVTMGLGFAASTIEYYTMVPSNISGPAGSLPPSGRRNYYVQQSRDSSFTFKVRTVIPGTNCGGGGTLSSATLVGQSSYNIPSGNIVPQPLPATSSNNLDSLGDRIMQKVQYRRVGSAESLWVTHTFRSSSAGSTGSQWAQINVTGGTVGTTPVQQQKYDPADGIYRWMSSIAADKDGNVALGYSTSSATSFPSIAYSGRLASDTPNMLPQSEAQLVAGNGSQINNCDNPPAPCHRWGDYSAMSIDPDGCTFWYTNQYYVSQTNASNGTWNTRIASFKFPSCGGSGTPTPTPVPETISTPTTPSGPSNGSPGTTYIYSTGGASSNLGHTMQYQFDWGDGSTSGWLAAGTTNASHTWSSSGMYSVKAQARCATHTSVFSSFSGIFSVTITTGEAISAPSAPSGPSSGSPVTNYTYTTGGASSSLGHSVQYLFDWGDGTTSGWLAAGTTGSSHAWSSSGSYSVKAQARCATHTSVFSSLSAGVSVQIGISPTPTPTPPCSPTWSPGSNLPVTALVRAVGNYFPANGRLYVLGGRNAETAGADFTHPFEYSPATNTWVTKSATLPDNQVNNMACGILTVSGTPQIYCVGGSAFGATTATARVFSYNPTTDSMATLTPVDNWPGNPTGTILPGGFAVAGNKLYLIGGFQLATNMTAQTWQFDPTAAAGSRWRQRLDYPVARGYIPATTIGGLIYTAGGSVTDGTTLMDTAEAFRYDPVANIWTAITNLPRVTGETRAVTVNSQMWVLGGGRTLPNPSNEVDIYTPGSNTWSTGAPFTTARRNFAADSDGSSRIWLAGGYDAALSNTMELYGGGGCGSGHLGNISTRLKIGTGENAMIAGFIINGTQNKPVIVRGLGPSLGALGVPGALANPIIEVHGPSGAIIPGAMNDNWQDAATRQQIIDSGLAPTNNLESALWGDLSAVAHTVIVQGKDNTVGVGLAEVYDVGPTADSKLANVSTRGFVDTGDNAMIGGMIIVGNNSTKVLFRAIGPSLFGFGISNALQDPMIELRDNNGNLLEANDNWRTAHEAEIAATGLAPTDDRESAIFRTLAPGAYTAIVRGSGNTTGVAVVEAYQLP
jgi:hypothetical protein